MLNIIETSQDSPQELVKELNQHLLKIIGTQNYVTTALDKQTYTKCIEEAQRIKSTASHLCVVGMGGSSLGAKAIHKTSDGPLSFFDTLDPTIFEDEIGKLDDIESTHWLITSKSGNTVETIAMTSLLEELYEHNGLSLSKNCTLLCEDKESPLHRWAKKNEVYCVYLDSDICGRFSVLSPVGLIPAAFCDIPIDEFLDGIEWATQNTYLITELAAQSISFFNKQPTTTYFWFYTDLLSLFGSWLQQLWSESLGKIKKDQQSSFPIILRGPADQHSVLQQLSDSPATQQIVFVTVAEHYSDPQISNSDDPKKLSNLLNWKPTSLVELINKQAETTMASLKEQGKNCLHIEIDELSPASLGALFISFELIVSVIGKYSELETYTQPHVEFSKQKLKQWLSDQQ